MHQSSAVQREIISRARLFLWTRGVSVPCNPTRLRAHNVQYGAANAATGILQGHATLLRNLYLFLFFTLFLTCTSLRRALIIPQITYIHLRHLVQKDLKISRLQKSKISRVLSTKILFFVGRICSHIVGFIIRGLNYSNDSEKKINKLISDVSKKCCQNVLNSSLFYSNDSWVNDD